MAGPRNLVLAPAGEPLLLLGDEAVARGAIEAGVGFAASYPGTPATEIGEALAFAGFGRLQFRWSVNEKIALESAQGACLAGARAIVAMKHLGLSYAGDPLSTLAYVGVNAGLVIVSAGDPGMATSPNEQDQRWLARMNHLPVLDPMDPAEALAMTRDAFALSEASELPVLLRITTAVAHTRAAVVPGPLPPGAVSRPPRLDPEHTVPVPARARRMRIRIEDRMAEARRRGAVWSQVRGEGSLGVIATGAPRALVHDWMDERGPTVRLLSLGMPWPLPEEEVAAFVSEVERVLVVEEMSPFVEEQVRALAQRRGIAVEILGKQTGDLPVAFAYDREIVDVALETLIGERRAPAARTASTLPPRIPTLCAGCPHRATFASVKQELGDAATCFNDIGCYTLGADPPLNSGDALLCMGSSIAQASGAARFLGKPAVAFIGDSTFFHSGMPALLDAVQAGADLLVVVMDNEVTAMTGFQPSPATGRGRTSIEDVCRALGAGRVRVVDPLAPAETVRAVRELAGCGGVRVLVARHPCPRAQAREGAPRRSPLHVDPARCRRCSAGGSCGILPNRAWDRVRSGAALGTGESGSPAAARAARIRATSIRAPCVDACPIGMCIQGQVGRIAAGDASDAWSLALRDNPLPASTGRVCHRPCEAACVAPERVPIRALRAWLGSEAPAATWPAPRPSGRRIAVAGAGPAGLAAARHLALCGHDVLLLDQAPRPGGLLADAIPAWRLPESELEADLARILSLDHLRFRGGVRIGRDASLRGLLDEHDAVLVALGGGPGRTLPGVAPEAAGVLDALSLLRRARSEGLAALGLAGKDVLVVGGGDVAVDAARAAVRAGARRVRMAAREEEKALPCGEEQAALARAEGVAIEGDVLPVEAAWEDDEVVVKMARVSGPGFERTSDSPWRTWCDALVVAIGQVPDHGWRDGIAFPVRTDGTVCCDENGRVDGLSGLWVAGDLAGGRRTVTDAIARGIAAARDIDRSLAGTGGMPEAPVVESRRALPPPELAAAAAKCRLCGTCASCAACFGLGCPAIHESDGRPVVDPDLCDGCGLCAAICPSGAFVGATA